MKPKPFFQSELMSGLPISVVSSLSCGTGELEGEGKMRATANEVDTSKSEREEPLYPAKPLSMWPQSLPLYPVD